MKITIDLSHLNTEEDDKLSSFEGAIATAESDYKEFAFTVADMVLKELHDRVKEELKAEQERVAVLEEMISSRMENTGEDRRTACIAVKKYICQSLMAQRDPDNYNKILHS